MSDENKSLEVININGKQQGWECGALKPEDKRPRFTFERTEKVLDDIRFKLAKEVK